MTTTPQFRVTTFAGLPAAVWRIGASEFMAVPSHGARLVTWAMNDGQGRQRNLIHWPCNAGETEFPFVRGGNPILFPFCARTFVDGKIHLWRDPHGVVRPMPLHGFARQAQFTVQRLDEGGFTAVMQPGTDVRAAYPFDYRFVVDYSFRADGLRVALSLENRGDIALPWSAGHHFYFAVPWSENKTRADYAIEIPAREAWQQNSRGGLEPVAVSQPRTRLDAATLLATMHGNLTGDTARLIELTSGDVMRINIRDVQERFPGAVFTTWTAGEHVPYFCIEPWIGPANAAELGRGVDQIAPGQAHDFVVELTFETERHFRYPQVPGPSFDQYSEPPTT